MVKLSRHEATAMMKRISNRGFISLMKNWGWTELNTHNGWTEMQSPDGRLKLDVRAATYEQNTPDTRMREVMMYTTRNGVDVTEFFSKLDDVLPPAKPKPEPKVTIVKDQPKKAGGQVMAPRTEAALLVLADAGVTLSSDEVHGRVKELMGSAVDRKDLLNSLSSLKASKKIVSMGLGMYRVAQPAPPEEKPNMTELVKDVKAAVKEPKPTPQEEIEAIDMDEMNEFVEELKAEESAKVVPAKAMELEPMTEEAITELLEKLCPNGFKAKHITAINDWMEATRTLDRTVNG